MTRDSVFEASHVSGRPWPSSAAAAPRSCVCEVVLRANRRGSTPRRKSSATMLSLMSAKSFCFWQTVAQVPRDSRKLVRGLPGHGQQGGESGLSKGLFWFLGRWVFATRVDPTSGSPQHQARRSKSGQHGSSRHSRCSRSISC